MGVIGDIPPPRELHPDEEVGLLAPDGDAPHKVRRDYERERACLHILVGDVRLQWIVRVDASECRV